MNERLRIQLNDTFPNNRKVVHDATDSVVAAPRDGIARHECTGVRPLGRLAAGLGAVFTGSLGRRAGGGRFPEWVECLD
jgi:hypothetical protein